KLIFDPSYVKLKLKAGVHDIVDKEVSLKKTWLKENIPHIGQVISDVKDDEGVEITINCNVEAFEWIIAYLQNDKDDYGDLFLKINDANYLNLLVSSCFLGLM